MTRACSERLLAAAARVQAAACSDPDPPAAAVVTMVTTGEEPREPATHVAWAAEAAERRRILAVQEVEVERSARALAALPRRRGTSTGRPKR